MPDIPLSSQIFDVAFHPTRPVLFAALLTGEIKAFNFDENFRTGYCEEGNEESARSGVEKGKVKSKGKGKLSAAVGSREVESVKLSNANPTSASSTFAQHLFTLRPSKRSCRGLSPNVDGTKVHAAGKGKAI